MANLQAILDQAGSETTVILPRGEHAGPIRINRPMIVDGENQALIAVRKGPAVLVTCSGVTLRRLQIEVTELGSAGVSREPDATVAIDAKPGCELRLEDVETRGEIRGVPGESGVWRLPQRLNLGELETRKPHQFHLELYAPSDVQLRTPISGLSFEPARLAPGLNQVKLRVDPVDYDDSVIGGRIEAVSNSGVVRTIMIQGRFRAQPRPGQALKPEAWIWRPSDRDKLAAGIIIDHPASSASNPSIAASGVRPSFSSATTPVFPPPSRPTAAAPPAPPTRSARPPQTSEPQSRQTEPEDSDLDFELQVASQAARKEPPQSSKIQARTPSRDNIQAQDDYEDDSDFEMGPRPVLKPSASFDSKRSEAKARAESPNVSKPRSPWLTVAAVAVAAAVLFAAGAILRYQLQRPSPSGEVTANSDGPTAQGEEAPRPGDGETVSNDSPEKSRDEVDSAVDPTPIPKKADASRSKKATATPTATANSRERKLASCGMTLLRIPADRFQMGAPDDLSEDKDYQPQDSEKPRHAVALSAPYFLGKHEITNGQCREIIEAIRTKNAAALAKLEFDVASLDDRPSDSPLVLVSWFDAVRLCNFASELEGLPLFYQIRDRDGEQPRVVVPNWSGPGFRLPTEAEWEHACRAEAEGPWPFEKGKAQQHAQFAKRDELCLVNDSKFLPNHWGLFHMLGNAEEWCWDLIAPYSRSEQTDPRGPASETAQDVLRKGNRVLRGGSCDSGIIRLNITVRSSMKPNARKKTVGFRMACNAVPAASKGDD